MTVHVRYHKPICEGCEKGPSMTTFPYVKRCTVYPWVPPYYIRVNQCPFNMQSVMVKKCKVRVGQQKQRRLR